MDRIAVLGDYDSIYGFGALGLEVVPVASNDPDAASKLDSLVESGYGIIYVTEELAKVLKTQIEHYSAQMLPAIVPLPGIKNNTGIGVAAVKHTVEQSVGSDILFGGK